jgi:hypothetical protein
MNTRQVFNVPHAMYRMDPGEVIELENGAFTGTAHSAHMCFSHAEGISSLRADSRGKWTRRVPATSITIQQAVESIGCVTF